MPKLRHVLASAIVLATLCPSRFAAAAPRQITVAADGSAEYRTIGAALATIPRDNSGRVAVFVKNGVYYEKVRVAQNRVTLQGESRAGVRLRYNLPRSEYDKRYDHVGPAVLNVFGEDVIVRDLTVENIQSSPEHAFAIYGQPQRFILDNCDVLGVGGDTLSLWNTAYGMYYHRNCRFTGGVDFVCPRGWCYIRDSQFESASTSAALWHDGHMNLDMKFVVENCKFDGPENFWLGRNHYPSQFYLLDCKFSKNMADKPIGVVSDVSNAPDPSVFERKYFRNCHREGGDFAWHANNLDSAPRDEIKRMAEMPNTAAWTFGGRWDPESEAAPTVTAVETDGDAVYVYFGEDVAGAGNTRVHRADDSTASYAGGDGTRRLEFRGGVADSTPNRLDPHGDELRGTVATLADRLVSAVDLPSASPRRAATILLIGDSTVAVDPVSNAYQGWGWPLAEFFDDRATIVNMARNGRSSKSFRAEGLWDEARQTKADFVIIQFGHNDNLGKGPERETDPAPGGEFRQNLARYVAETRALGAEPILVTPPTRRVFDDVGGIRADEANVPYAEATLAVAQELDCPVVDLNRLSRELFERLGEASSHWLQVEEDRTHFTPAGARRIAAIVLADLQVRVPELRPFILQDELWRH
jgi:pectinesterase